MSLQLFKSANKSFRHAALTTKLQKSSEMDVRRGVHSVNGLKGAMENLNTVITKWKTDSAISRLQSLKSLKNDLAICERAIRDMGLILALRLRRQ